MGETPEFDHVVVGGGAAGAVVAARLSEDPGVRVALVEWGPDDRGEPRALQIRRWAEMLEGEYDLDYRSVEQERGNSGIGHSRARILGGCSSHNTMIAFRPPDSDFEDWVARGARGWDAATMLRCHEKLLTRIEPVAPEHRNPYLEDVIQTASRVLGVPVRERWSDAPWADGAGFLEIGYDPATGVRSSSSVSYLHPVMDARENLHVLTGRRALRVRFDESARATGVEVRREADGGIERLAARGEVILCCGAVDTPRLLLHSGVGRGSDLQALGIDAVADVPGVGEHLSDHVEGLVVWEPSRPVPTQAATGWDAAFMTHASDPDARVPELLTHIPIETFGVHAERAGWELPEHTISISPNVTRTRSRGRVWIDSPDPAAPPKLDPRYFSDPDGYDERTLLAGVAQARRVAAEEPMAGWVAREVFPGPSYREGSDELAELVRRTSNTVYHLSCTCRMGAAEDPLAVLDPELRVRGVRGLRVADASAFPSLTTVNPVVAVLMLAERAAELIAR